VVTQPNRSVIANLPGTLVNGSEHICAMGRAPLGLDPSTEHLRATESARACADLESFSFREGGVTAVSIIHCPNRLQVKLSQLKTALF
jgi:hypothetical protein